MPAWPGGPCPNCGEDMPEKMIHCRECRTLLNKDLVRDSVEVPKFSPLPEIAAMIDVPVRGIYLDCPSCGEELKIHLEYFGNRVMCKHCSSPFLLEHGNPAVEKGAFYADCPECDERLRFSRKYLGQKVACRYCGGKLNLLPSGVTE